MKIKAIQAHYKGKGGFFNRLIRLRTWSKYSHSEIIINGVWYSASHTDGGVRAKRITPKPKHWDYEVIEVDAEWANYVFNRMQGKGYDWLGIFFSQAVPLDIHAIKKAFCSEYCAIVRCLKNPNQISPAKLAKRRHIKQGLTQEIIDLYKEV